MAKRRVFGTAIVTAMAILTLSAASTAALASGADTTRPARRASSTPRATTA
jgi:hypothetical protein